MTDLEKTIYQNMRPIDRVMTYLIKSDELIEFGRLMDDNDLQLLKKFFAYYSKHCKEDCHEVSEP